MKFILISRHPAGSKIPAEDAEQNLKEMGEWVTLLKATVAMPITSGKVVTAKSVDSYAGDLGGLIIFEADSLDDALDLTRKSPGLKYGFTHEVFPEISLQEAASIR